MRGRRSSAGLAASAGFSEPPVSVSSANLAHTRAVLRPGTGLPPAPAPAPASSAGAGCLQHGPGLVPPRPDRRTKNPSTKKLLTCAAASSSTYLCCVRSYRPSRRARHTRVRRPRGRARVPGRGRGRARGRGRPAAAGPAPSPAYSPLGACKQRRISFIYTTLML